jgi:hypothetical protein
VQPTSGILRDFTQFSTPQQNPVFKPGPRPAHLRLTQTVGRLAEKDNELEKTEWVINLQVMSNHLYRIPL